MNVPIMIAGSILTVIEYEVVADQAFKQQIDQSTSLRDKDEHLDRATLLLLSIPGEGTPNCRQRSGESNGPSRDASGKANYAVCKRPSFL